MLNKKYFIKNIDKKYFFHYIYYKLIQGGFLMKTYIVFFNKTGKRKLAIELKDKITVYEMTETVSKLVNGLCTENGYTFSYHNIDKNNDTQGLLKNIPILSVVSCL